MTARNFLFRIFPASPSLQPYVDCFGLFETSHQGAVIHTLSGEQCHQTIPDNDRLADCVIPDGRMMLMFNLGDPVTLVREFEKIQLKAPAQLIGANTGRASMEFGNRVACLGVMFRPGRAAPFIQVPADELAGRFTALADLWGRDASRLEEQVRELSTTPAQIERIERRLLHLLRRSESPDERFASLADFIGRRGGDVRVESLSEASGLSRQHLTRKFRRLIGTTPKQFCRLARFDALFRAAYSSPQVDWAAVAVECGYYDQAHLIAEFKEFTGLSPTQFFSPSEKLRA